MDARAQDFTDEQRRRLGEWTTRATGQQSLTCTICGGMKWSILGYVLLPISRHPRQRDTSVTITTLAISCIGCGHVEQIAETPENPLPHL